MSDKVLDETRPPAQATPGNCNQRDNVATRPDVRAETHEHLDGQPSCGCVSLHTELKTLVRDLERRAYKTYLSRVEASKRLRLRQSAWNAAIVSLTLATTFASISLLADEGIFGAAGPALLVCLSVLSLVASLTVSGLDYSARAKNMFNNYRKLQRLAQDLEAYAKNPAQWSFDRYSELFQTYQLLIDESENHSTADYVRAMSNHHQDPYLASLTPDPSTVNSSAARVDSDKLTRNIKRKLISDVIVSSLPFASLAIPLAIIFPLFFWIIES